MKIDKIVSGKLNNNTYIVSNDKDCIIIDCSCSLDEIKSRVKDLNVLGVFLTHGHYDHFVSLEEVVKHYNTPCYISSLDYEKLFNPKANYSIVFKKIYSVKLPKEDFVLLDNDGGNVVLKSFTISYFLTKGHTNGSLCFLVNDECLFTGDTIFSNSCGRTDLISGSEEEMIDSLKFLKNKFEGIKFYPGHGTTGIV